MVVEGKLVLEDRDFESARLFHKQEKIDPITLENMFRGGLYCILSAAENYPKQMVIYKRLLYEGFDEPWSIIPNESKLIEILSGARFPNNKSKSIFRYACWWTRSKLPSEIIQDIKDGRERELELRDKFGKECPGMWLKNASLFMNMLGYENVVPVDIWILRALRDMGYEDVTVTDYRKVSGLSKRNYLEYERRITEVARKNGKSPAEFQLAIWCRTSKRRPDLQLDLF